MRIYTSSWFEKLPDTVQKIGVSRGTPRGYPAGFRKMMELAPGPWFNSVGVAEYKRLYFESLAKLDPQKEVDRMADLAGGKEAVALLCYESPKKDEDWCHRGMISAWLADTLGLEVCEFGYEDRGFGWNHPKLPLQFRGGYKPDPLDVSPFIGSTATDRHGVLWTVRGTDAENIDQALIEAVDGRRCAISADVLKSKFQPVQ